MLKDSLPRLALVALLSASCLALACSSWDPDDDDPGAQSAALRADAREAVREFRASDSSLGRFFDEAFGYAVFPSVGKGAIGVGGAYGDGVVYESGVFDGYTSLSQVTIGFQLGGQEYMEIIFFQDRAALDNFRRGNFELSAQASAVAVKEGAATDVGYDGGVAIFTATKGGLMFEASVGGQKFTYRKG